MKFTQLRLFPKTIDLDSNLIDSPEGMLFFQTYWNGCFTTEFLFLTEELV